MEKIFVFDLGNVIVRPMSIKKLYEKLNCQVSFEDFYEYLKNDQSSEEIHKGLISTEEYIKKIENNEVEWERRSLSEVIEINDVVCVVFMDRNFKQNLKQSRSSYKLSNLNDEQKYHSESYGIVIGVMNKHTSNI